MSQYEEDEYNWWYVKLINNYRKKSETRRTGINSRDIICSSLYYCKVCDQLYTKTGYSGSKKENYYEYYTRKDLSFYGFINNEEKRKVCERCNEEK